jgi:aspartyl-tRNA(Asn)/glutamyl-tRNA(Gln) amidotransferase subunit B
VADRTSGERTAISEIKNLNSFRYMVDALKYEVARHVEALKKGDKLTHETRLYDSARGETRPMRSKEEIMDYRYFPEPDLNPLEIPREWIDEVRRALPELPDERRARYVRELGLPEYDAGVLVAEKEVAEFFEQCAAKSKDPKQASNWVMGEVLRELKDSRRAISEIPVSPTALAELLALINDGTITNNIAKEVFAEMAKSGKPPAEIVKTKGMAQISDSGELEEAVKKVISENGKAVADYRAGKKQAAGFLMGQVMRATKGKANPDVVQQLIKKILG